MTNDYPLVSIISINYNNVEVTCEMLSSLRKITYPNVEVIIVDNFSKENPDSIKERFPEVLLIKNNKNAGFAGGNNIGFKAAKGKYFLLLNNDTEVAPDFLEPLVRRLEKKPTIGVVSPKIIFHHSPGIIQFAGFNPINPFTGRGTAIGYGMKDDGSFDKSMPTSRAHGAAMMIPRHVVKRIGLMADLYFLYYEEMDYCERIRNAGYSIWYEAASTIYHKESMSTGKNSTLKTYYLTRNRLLYQRRNVQGLKLWISLLFFGLISFPKGIIQYIIKGQFNMLKAFINGVWWNITNHRIHHNESLI